MQLLHTGHPPPLKKDFSFPQFTENAMVSVPLLIYSPWNYDTQQDKTIQSKNKKMRTKLVVFETLSTLHLPGWLHEILRMHTY